MAHSCEEELESFTITFRREIVFYLRQLINDAERVDVMFDDGRHLLPTVLLDVDEEEGTLVFDMAGSETENQALLNADHANFVANPIGVRNEFTTRKFWKTTFQKRPAFATAIPEKFIRLQRREFFRLNLPVTQRRPCSFKDDKGKQWDMVLVDIGLGGAGLESQVAVPFELKQVLSRVRIDLGNFGKLEVDLEIRFLGTVNRAGKEVSRVGCHFVRLSNAQENELQRFITQVQREERAKLG